MEMITDIWFDTELELEELADKLNMEEVEHDYENVFEWVVGKFNGYDLNLSREHGDFERPPSCTRIFVSSENGEDGEYPAYLREILTSKIREIGISPIYLGEVTIGRDSKFILNPLDKVL